MFSIVIPAVCALALKELAPADWTTEDVARKAERVLKSELGKLNFAVQARKAGAKAVRLKFNDKKVLATFSASMGASTKDLNAKVRDLYNWTFDVAEFEAAWGEGSLACAKVPVEIVDWAKTWLKPAPVAAAEAA